MSFGTLATAVNGKESYAKYFIGTVVNIADPDGNHRVQAVIPGIYEGDNLPWIGPAAKSAFGIGANFGTYGNPQLGAVLLVELQEGDAHYPIYHGCLYLQGNKSDALKEAYHEEAWGFVDPAGNRLLVDMRDKFIEFEDSHGVIFDLREGNLSVTVPQDLTVTVEANGTIDISGDATLSVGGDASATVTGNLSAAVGGDVAVDVSGDLNATVAGKLGASVSGDLNASIGGAANVTASGDMTLTGATLSLNGG